MFLFIFNWMLQSLWIHCSGLRSAVCTVWVEAARGIQGVMTPFAKAQKQWGNVTQVSLTLSLTHCRPHPNRVSAKHSGLFGLCWDFFAARILSSWGKLWASHSWVGFMSASWISVYRYPNMCSWYPSDSLTLPVQLYNGMTDCDKSPLSNFLTVSAQKTTLALWWLTLISLVILTYSVHRET